MATRDRDREKTGGHRRRRDETGGGHAEDGKRSHRDRDRSRSHSGRKKRRREHAVASIGVPPQDWLGPANNSRGPPPAEWRGPPGYAGMPPSGMSYPPPPARPPQRPSGMFPMARGQGPEYAWPAMPYPGDPPGEWHGAAMQRPPYGARPPGDPADMWGQRPPSVPQTSPFAAPPGSADGTTAFPSSFQPGKGREMEKSYEAPPKQLALADADTRGKGADTVPPPVSAAPAAAITNAGMASSGNTSLADGRDDDPAPAPRTLSDRFRNVRIVQSALSEEMIASLRKKCIPVESPIGQIISTTSPDDSGLIEDNALASECSRLGLDGGTQRARLPMPGPLKLPVCSVELSHVGLWERFRKQCGTPISGEATAMQLEVCKSRGGGHVVVPLVGLAPTTVPVSG